MASAATDNVLSVASVPTTVAGFVGHTELADRGIETLTGVPTPIDSFEQYQSRFGGPAAREEYVLYESVASFFANGGRRCYVLSVGSHGDSIDSWGLVQGVQALASCVEPAIIVCPDATALSLQDCLSVHQASLSICEYQQDRIAVLDLPRESGTASVDAIERFREGIGELGLSYGAAYTPWLKTDSRPIPPSGAVAGAISEIERLDGVWRPPANVALRGVHGVTTTLDEPQIEAIYLDPTAGRSINPIRVLDDAGVYLWGTRTLAGASDAWRYLHVRRLVIQIKRSVLGALGALTFNVNDAPLWDAVRAGVSRYLQQLWQAGALLGATAEEAYFVRVGYGQTMSQVDIDAGRLVVEVGVAAVNPAEFAVLEIRHHGVMA